MLACQLCLPAAMTEARAIVALAHISGHILEHIRLQRHVHIHRPDDITQLRPLHIQDPWQ